MDQSLKEKFKNVIITLDEQFTSHDFIKKFLAKYEDDYREWVANASLQSVNAKIGKILSDNQEALGIMKSIKVNSETFHGTMGNIQKWQKVKSVLASGTVKCFLLIAVLFVLESLNGYVYADNSYQEEPRSIIESLENQVKGWEWLFTEESNMIREHYPNDVSFNQYASHPEYRIKYYNESGCSQIVFDTCGNLVRVGFLPPYEINIYAPSAVSETIKNSESRAVCTLLRNHFTNILEEMFSLCESNYNFYFFSLNNEHNRIRNPYSLLETKESEDKEEWYNCLRKAGLKVDNDTISCGIGIKKEINKIGLLGRTNVYYDSRTNVYYDKYNHLELDVDDIAALQQWYDKLSKGNKDYTFIIETKPVSKKKYSVFLKCVSHLNVSNAKIYQPSIAVFVEHIDDSKTKIMREIETELMNTELVKAYHANKYNVSAEAESVKNEIEIGLGLRKSYYEIDEKKKERMFLEALASTLNINYKPGMTKEQIGAIVRKRYEGYPAAETAKELAPAVITASLIVEKKIHNDANSKRDKNAVDKASRYIEQLKSDYMKNFNETPIVTRVDDCTFNVKYTFKNQSPHNVIVSFNSKKPYEIGYTITFK